MILTEHFKELIKNFPELDIGDRIGFTTYIDFLRWEEVTYPVMQGQDSYGRLFFVVKILITDVKVMQTFFQRYSDNDSWQSGNHSTNYSLLDTIGGLSDNQINLLTELLEKETVVVNENHRPYIESYINEKAILYDEKKIKASNLIKRAWKLCRYTPGYKMCEKVQINNLNEVGVILMD